MSYAGIQLTEEEMSLLEHFDSENPVQYGFDEVQCLTCHHLLNLSREKNGVYYWTLSRDGRLVLEGKRKKDAEKEEQRTREKAAEAQRLQERHEDQAREEHYHRSQNRVAIAAAVIGSGLSFILGLVVEHHAGFVDSLAQILHTVAHLF